MPTDSLQVLGQAFAQRPFGVQIFALLELDVRDEQRQSIDRPFTLPPASDRVFLAGPDHLGQIFPSKRYGKPIRGFGLGKPSPCGEDVATSALERRDPGLAEQ